MQHVTGIVQKVFVKELDNPRPFTFQGKTITNTHRHSLQLDDGNWYGFGDSDRDVFLGKDPSDGKNKVLGEGSQVLIMYSMSPCGKYRNAKKSNMTVLSFVQGQKWEPQAQQGIGQQARTNAGGGFDLTGVKVGHAINAAMLLLNDKPNSVGHLRDVAIQLHDISARVEAAYKAANPGMSARDIGSASGHAVLNACKLKDDINGVEQTALGILNNVVPAVTAYVKGEVSPQQPVQQPVQQGTTTVAQEEQQPPVQKQPPVSQQAEVNNEFEGFSDMDDFSMDDVQF